MSLLTLEKKLEQTEKQVKELQDRITSLENELQDRITSLEKALTKSSTKKESK